MARSGKRKGRPASTLEGRENQLVSLAVDEAERHIRAGTASSQVLTHFLKLGTTREQLEQERMREELELTKAKVSELQSREKVEHLYADAIRAFRNYSGQDDDDDDDDYEYDYEYDDEG